LREKQGCARQRNEENGKNLFHLLLPEQLYPNARENQIFWSAVKHLELGASGPITEVGLGDSEHARYIAFFS
jgi:hypothetical protein